MVKRTICEVGVNLPQHSKAILMATSEDHLILVEPDPHCVQQIRSYCQIAGLGATIHQNAIWHENTTAENPLELAQSKRCCLSGYIVGIHSPMVTRGTELAALDTLSVRGITFDQVDIGDIDILFIDNEGCEWYVLQNMISRPSKIQVEMAGKQYRNPHYAEIMHWMQENGYQRTSVSRSDYIFEKKS